MEVLSTFRLFLGGFLLAVSFPPGDETPTCPRGWRQLKGYCYGFFNLNVNWMRAELDCQSLRSKSHLASIVNAEETDLLSKYLYETYTQRKSVWIGMYENKIATLENRYFEWTDRTAVDYTSWAPGEPYHIKKHCAVLRKPVVISTEDVVISTEELRQQRNTRNVVTNSGISDGVTILFPTCVNLKYDA